MMCEHAVSVPREGYHRSAARMHRRVAMVPGGMASAGYLFRRT